MRNISKYILTVLCVVGLYLISSAQFTNCSLAAIDTLKKRGTVAVAISDDESTNQTVQEVMATYWAGSKFIVIKKSELATYISANPENYVLTYMFDHDVHNFNKPPQSKDLGNGREALQMQVIGDCLILVKNLKRANNIKLTDAMINCYIDYEMRIVNERAEFARQIGAISAILSFPDVQENQIGKWKIPTINQNSVISKELWLSDIDVNKKEEDIKMQEAYAPYKYKIVTKQEIAKAITEKRKDVVYLARAEYKLGVNLFFVHSSEDNRILFFTKGEGRFSVVGFGNIKNNQPHGN
jgi:hypothetical protein